MMMQMAVAAFPKDCPALQTAESLPRPNHSLSSRFGSHSTSSSLRENLRVSEAVLSFLGECCLEGEIKQQDPLQQRPRAHHC